MHKTCSVNTEIPVFSVRAKGNSPQPQPELFVIFSEIWSESFMVADSFPPG